MSNQYKRFYTLHNWHCTTDTSDGCPPHLQPVKVTRGWVSHKCPTPVARWPLRRVLSVSPAAAHHTDTVVSKRTGNPLEFFALRLAVVPISQLCHQIIGDCCKGGPSDACKWTSDEQLWHHWPVPLVILSSLVVFSPSLPAHEASHL